MKIRPLTAADISDVLSKDIIIGSDSATGGRFVFNASLGRYRFLIDGSEYDYAPAADWCLVEALLAKYNTFIGAC